MPKRNWPAEQARARHYIAQMRAILLAAEKRRAEKKAAETHNQPLLRFNWS